MLCRLGRADAVVGITVYCREPAGLLAGKTRIGGEKDPDLGRILALAPELVVANVEENQAGHIAALRAAGIPVWVSFPRTVDESVALIRDAGTLTGAEPAAAAMIAEIDALRSEVRASLASRAPVRVFYPIWREPWMTIGRDTYIHDVLATCGGANVYADAERYPTVTLDAVAARRPDVIVLPDEPFRFRRAHLADFTPFADVPAVAHRRIHLVDGKPFSWHGPRLADALRVIPPLLHR
ncbi:MAG: ABC transporter substrate-binding protein [Candidatus Rokubacteria bacterium]|nr:ABC transporter substrate-binding protein [Candidatus Rokubacteria bacterium]